MEKFNLVIRWNILLLQAIRAERKGTLDDKKALPPPMAARSIAMLHTAMYDAWAHYDMVANPVYLRNFQRVEKHDCNDNNRKIAVSHAAFNILCDLFPTGKELKMFQSLMNEYNYTDSNSTHAQIGIKSALSVLQYRKDDDFLSPSDYKPKNSADKLNDINRWQPLKNDDGSVQSFLLPDWGTTVQPFAINLNDHSFKAKPPIHYPKPLPLDPTQQYSEKEESDAKNFEKQCREVLKYSESLDDTKKMIAEYWAAGPASITPPGHWCVLAQYVSLRDYHDLNDDVKLFFALGNGLLDASIAAWYAKRRYDSVRPITAIKSLLRDKKVIAWKGSYNGIGEIDAQDWQTYIPTPPFAEHISGHSTFSASAANVLRCFTQKEYFGFEVSLAAGSSTREPGMVPAKNITLKFKTFLEAAEQAGISRIYGGIHFMNGNTEGLNIGKKVGDAVFKKAQGFWNGALSNKEESIENC